MLTACDDSYTTRPDLTLPDSAELDRDAVALMHLLLLIFDV